uniref:Uncharacterized protein n=1 Tax=Tanacetum cinerariifolium TaxID=118510 RepID=A0A6L2LYI0_TANCI|nr:hypothetical protein [Tanacetum cinerariifolium]
MSGITTYVGFYEVFPPKEGEYVYVSATSDTSPKICILSTTGETLPFPLVLPYSALPSICASALGCASTDVQTLLDIDDSKTSRNVFMHIKPVPTTAYEYDVTIDSGIVGITPLTRSLPEMFDETYGSFVVEDEDGENTFFLGLVLIESWVCNSDFGIIFHMFSSSPITSAIDGRSSVSSLQHLTAKLTSFSTHFDGYNHVNIWIYSEE